MKYVLKLEKNIKLNEFNKKTKLNLKKNIRQRKLLSKEVFEVNNID